MADQLDFTFYFLILQNGYRNFIYPAAPGAWLCTILVCLILRMGFDIDPSRGFIDKIGGMPL